LPPGATRFTEPTAEEIAGGVSQLVADRLCEPVRLLATQSVARMLAGSDDWVREHAAISVSIASSRVSLTAEQIPVDDAVAVIGARGELDRLTSDQLKLDLRIAIDRGFRYVSSTCLRFRTWIRADSHR